MAPNPKVKAAFKAMREIGIPEEKTKPALKRLLKLYDKNWDLIEAESYRVLADAIFEYEDTETAEKEKKKISGNLDQGEVIEEAGQLHDESERPLKRLRLKYQGQAAPSPGHHSPTSASFPLKIPKPEPGEPEASPSQRTQPSTGSPQPLVRNKGKQPVSPQTNQRNIRAAPERPSQALQIKEPKIEPGVKPVQKQPNVSNLIKPKDEPFTDDMLSLEPLAVLPPDRMQHEVLSNSGNPTVGQAEHIRQEAPSNSGNPVCSQDQGSGASKTVETMNKGLGTLASSNEKINHNLEADISERTPAKIDIVASSVGEVKLLLSCNSSSGLEGKTFHFQDLEEVLKKVNDICLKKYKIMDPDFSVRKVMEEVCEYVGALGTINDGVDKEKPIQQDVGVIDNGTCCLQPNGSMDAEASVNVAATTGMTENDASILPSDSPLNVQSDKSSAVDHLAEMNDSVADLNMNSLVVVPQKQVNHTDMQVILGTSDIARGIEAVKVPLEDAYCDFPPSFHYISQNVISHNANLFFSLAQIGDQHCCHSCRDNCLASSASCKCARHNGGESSYSSYGIVREDLLDKCISMARNPQKDYVSYCKECPLERLKNEDMLDPCKGHLKRIFIKECWTKCGCNKNCGNRVVQHGINHNLEVFWTPEGKGWGLRTLEDLPKGAFVCEYIGEILTCKELHKRSLKRSNDKHSFAVLLDTDWGTRALKEEEFLCLDATVYGNAARFINHRCSDANLIEIPVEVETPNHHYYHVALFTTRQINAFEELTWDYGIDFDDGEHHIKAFRCLCGSSFCRNMKRSSRSRSTITIQ